MYITCPRCYTKFILNSDEIILERMKLKCSQCSYIWHQERVREKSVGTLSKESSTREQEQHYHDHEHDKHWKIKDKKVDKEVLTTPAYPLPINLPILRPVSNAPYLYSFPVFIIGIIILLGLMLFADSLPDYLLNKQIFNKLNINELEISRDLTRNKILLKYKIVNSFSYQIKVPLIRIKLFNKNNRLIYSVTVPPAIAEIKPYSNNEEITELFPANLDVREVEKIEVMLGNKIDFLLH